jgi:hypothetical protein
MSQERGASFFVTHAARALVLTFFFSAAVGRAQNVTPAVVAPTRITFSSLPGPNGAPYLGHTEGDFAITPTTTNWFQGLVYGNPVVSIFDGPTNSPGSAKIVISDRVGPFTLTAFDYSSNNGDSFYDVQGFLGASMLFEETGTLFGSFPPNFGFQTLLSAYSTTPIDGLFIQVDPGAGVTSINLDNIVVTTIPIPEPGSLVLLGLGVVCLCLCRRSCATRAARDCQHRAL